jgi:hypothetical protein
MNDASAGSSGTLVDRDSEHLKLLSIFHYVLAGLTALGGLVPVIHVTLGFLMLTGVIDGRDDEIRPVGALIMMLGLGLMALLWTFAALLFFAGRSLGRRRNYTFCMIVAGIMCLNLPLGTVLGVFTILVLMRPSVQELFSAEPETA